MRGFVRTAVPEVLVLKGAQWTQQWTELRERNATANFPWYQHEKKTAREWLIPILRAMTDGHCAFCEAFPLEGQSNEPIEHSVPSRYSIISHMIGIISTTAAKSVNHRKTNSGRKIYLRLTHRDIAGQTGSNSTTRQAN